MSKIFTINKDFGVNYLASIQRIENIVPIPNADKLVKTTISGYDMIISKDMKVGDLVVYFPCESCICEKFLSANNLYDRSNFELNSNAEDVKKLIEQAEKQEGDAQQETLNKIRSMCGFFNNKNRVRILKLRGEYSQGFIAGVSSLVNAFPALADVDFEKMVGEQFNEINGEKFCWKYVPVTKEHQHGSQSHWKKRMKSLNKFDRIIPGTFVFHYDTTMLAEHIRELSPDDVVTISVKVHGTSAIFANIPVNRKLNTWEKIKKFLGMKVQLTENGNVYSSRTVIKNQYLNKDVTSGFYGTDVWGSVNKMIAPFIVPGQTVYGEIVGYLDGSQQMIQKDHDYGCQPGCWKFMPYRITTSTSDGKYEWNLAEVYEWTLKLQKENPGIADKLMPVNILYHGRFGDLYPAISESEHWHTNVLEMMKTDAKANALGHRGWNMELREPMCKNKVPREGVVIRIDNDKTARAWKLKTKAHYGIEAMQHDADEADIEETA
mgnify:CR=1 FL=1